MKILSTAWSIFDLKKNPIEISRDGGSIMISDICEYIGRKVQSYLFIGAHRTKEWNYNNIYIIDNEKYLPLCRTTDNIDDWQMGLMKRFGEHLDAIKPDMVLVQGGAEFSTNCMLECMRRRQPFVFVTHLLASGNSLYQFSERLVKWEKSVFDIPNIHVITVGNGMRNKILKENPQLTEKQVVAIPNGTPLDCDTGGKLQNKEFETEKRKILLCNGSLQPRKNQLQLVNAFVLLPEYIKKNLLILFCGSASPKNGYKEQLVQAIQEYHLESSLKYIGEMPRDEMTNLYAYADGLVMPALCEGLSLVALEMLRFGKPVIMFPDNETAADVNDERVVVFAKNHSDQALADAIEEWYNSDWDYSYIKKYSDYFTMDRVADDYIDYCKTRKGNL